MPFSLNRGLAHSMRGVYSLSSSVPVTPGVIGEYIHSLATAGVTLDSQGTPAAQTNVMSFVDQTNAHTANATSFATAPRYNPYGVNGKPALYYPGYGFVSLNYDATSRGWKNNVPGQTAIMAITPDGSATANLPFLFSAQGTNAGTNGFTVGVTANNALYGAFRRTDTSATVSVVTPNNTYVTGESFVLTVVADWAVGNGTDATVSFYKNNVLIQTFALTGAGIGNSSATDAAALILGGPAGINGGIVSIGETYLYPRALSTSDRTVQSSLVQANAEINAIQITNPTSLQAFNRNLTTNLQSMTISGTYIGTPTAIEANWSAQGSTYVTIASGSVGTMASGAFSGTLTGLPPGQGRLTVRFTNDTTQYCKREAVTITDLILITGQSNNTDVLDPTYSDPQVPQNPKTYTLGSSGMKVPVFNSRFAWAKWFDLQKCSAWFVAFAQDYYNRHGYPPAFVLAAIGGTNSGKWRSDSTDTYGGTIAQGYGDAFGLTMTLVARAISMGNTASSGTGINIIDHEQGEADSGGTVSQATYLGNITNTFATLSAAFPNAVIMNCLLQIQLDSSGATISTTNVNGAITQGWTTLPKVAPGADLTGLTSDHRAVDGTGALAVHLCSDSNVAAQAAAKGTAMAANTGSGPILDYMTASSARIAYGIRKLRAAYSGPCMNVRFSNGTANTDIGFDAYGNLDTATLLSLAGSGSAYVSIWYDQGPLVAHARQATTTKQPVIVSAGVLNIQGAQKAFFQLDQSTTYFDVDAAGYSLLNGAAGVYSAYVGAEAQNNDATPGNRIIWVANVNASTSARFALQTANNSTTPITATGSSNNQFAAAFRKTDAASIAFHFSGSDNPQSSFVNNVPFVFHNQHNITAATNTFFINGVSGGALTTGQTAGGTFDATNVSLIRIGASGAVSPIQYDKGRPQELIIQAGLMPDIDRIKLAHSQGFYYGMAIT